MKNGNFILCIVLMVSVAFFACAQRYDPESDFEASPQDGGKSVLITKYVGSKWEVRIPPRIQGLPVTHIGDEAFSGKKLISVTIPNSVTHIGNSAFSANQLTNVNIPNSVTHIGASAFFNNKLTSVTIPASVTSIEDKAFITIGGQRYQSGTHAFSGNNLTAINVAAGNSAYASENGVLYNKNKTVLHMYPAGKTDSSFIIPSSVTSIGDIAFLGCDNLTSITIPASVTTIGDSAFYWCSSLTSLTIPSSVTSIGKYAFDDCTGLTGRFFEVLRPLADIMSDFESVPAQERRDQYDDILAAAQASQPAVVSIFTVWKPNVLADWRPPNVSGGFDTDYIGRPGSTPTGQYAPAFTKENGIIEKRMFTDVQGVMEHLNGPNARQERAEPAPFKVNGQDAWIFRIAVPIINPRTMEVVGTVGGYCDIR